MKRDNRENAATWNRIEQRRLEFGVLLRRYRIERRMSCEELAAKTGKISRTALATIERGQRQAGATVSERLADALSLNGEQRQAFLVAGLRTTVSQMLPVKSKGLDPELFMPIWQFLRKTGISANDGHRFRLNGEINSESPEPLKRAALRLAENAERLSARIRAALDGTDSHILLDIEIETQGGKMLLLELLSGSSEQLPLANRKASNR